MKTLTRLLVAALVAVTCSSVHVYAQSPTNPSSPEEGSSTGVSNILMTIPELFMVSGVSNIDFGTLTDSDNIITGASSILTSSDTLCVYSNRSDQTYRVDLTGNGSGSTFRIQHSGGAFIPYRVYWNDDSTAARGTQVGTKGGTTNFLTTQDGSNEYDCNSTNNTRFDIEFDRDDILDVREGAYSGTLTIVISAPT